MSSMLIIDPLEFPQLAGQEIGRELELEIAAVVTAVPDPEGNPPRLTVELAIIGADITQTT